MLLAQENNMHSQRADLIMKEMDEMGKGLVQIKEDGLMSQGILEASMALIKDLIRQREKIADKRMSEMSATMKERDRQADKRLKLMSKLRQRRDSDDKNCMIELMTAMNVLTLGVRAVVAKAAAAPSRPPPMPMAPNLATVPSTSAFPPPQQTTYRKVAKPSGEQIK